MPLSLLLLVLLGSPPGGHPLHSSSASLTATGADVQVIVRIFRDDLAVVAPGGDSAMVAYVRERVMITGRNGQLMKLDVATIVQDGDRIQVTFRGTAQQGLAGAKVQLAILWDRYHDQVNLLRATIGGRTTTLVFSKGDPPKELR